MRGWRVRVGTAGWIALSLVVARSLPQEAPERVAPESASGLDFYAQGGVVVDGVAYFTANDHFKRPGIRRTASFPSVVAFDLCTFRKLRTYPFART